MSSLRALAAGLGLLVLVGCSPPVPPAPLRPVLDLSGDGWQLVLDPQARWQDDALHLPGVALDTLPLHPPSMGWEGLAAAARPIAVPGTVEGLLWDELGGDYVGVSWWLCELELAEPLDGRRAVLRFESVRLRAEVFVDEQLCGYDAVGHTPFEVDVSAALARPGSHRLAVRVTDPGGNFDWRDEAAHAWGSQPIPASHGFGGLLGPVRLELRPAQYLADVFVRNEADLEQVDVVVSLGGVGWRVDPAAVGGAEPSDGGAVGPVGSLEGGLDPTPPASDPLTADALGRGRVLHVVLATAARPGVVLAERYASAETPRPGPDGPCVVLRLPATALPLWSPDAPELALCRVTLLEAGQPTDELTVRFGRRWFAPDGLGQEAVLRLNGQRVVLRSAISWGFWPVTGAVPSPALAVRQVETARALGLNMLNHHRNLAAPGLLDAHDELGLLAYLEPGGYASVGGDALCFAFAREKWLRMVRRDRNHPSVVIYNLINEAKQAPDARTDADLRAAQVLDPTRLITYTSGWSEDDGFDRHARPGQPGLFDEGWYDQHEAPGPGVDRDEFWNGPDDFRRRSERRGEIVLHGEEGAIATPARLARAAEELGDGPRGWDGQLLLDRAAGLQGWLAEHGWPHAPADVDALTTSMADVAYHYQAATLLNVRLGDVADGYVVNGWEDSKLENHSGIVDAFRLPKGDGRLLAAAAAPRLLAVKARRRVLQAGTDHGHGVRSPAVVEVDVFLVDEQPQAGRYSLWLGLRAPDGSLLRSARRPVEVVGGEVFGQLLASGLRVLVEGGPGRYRVEAALQPVASAADTPGAQQRGLAGDGAQEGLPDGVQGLPDGAEVLARGEQELLLVDWKSQPVPPGGALLVGDGQVAQFLNTTRAAEVPTFAPELPPLDWVLLSDLDPEPFELLPASALTAPDGTPGALLGEYHAGSALGPDALVAQRLDAGVDAGLDLAFPDEGPLPELPAQVYCVRWSGTLRAPEAGLYRFAALSSGGVRLWIDDQLLLDEWREHGPERHASRSIVLDPARPVGLRLEYLQEADNSRLSLEWCPPAASAAGRTLAEQLVARATADGTTLLVLDHTDAWARLLSDLGAVDLQGVLTLGRYWLGGNLFARPHALLAGLPSEGGLDWEYQELVHYGMRQYGLLLQGEEAIVGCLADHRPQPATVVGVVPCGRGRLLLCTLDLPRALLGPPGPHDLVKALLMNALAWAAGG